MQKSIDTQNAAILKLKQDEADRFAKHKIDLENAKRQADRYKKQATDLMNRKPTPGIPVCEDVNNLINGESVK